MRGEGRGTREKSKKDLQDVDPSSLTPYGRSPVSSEVGRPSPLIRRLGLAPYETVWRNMQSFTTARTASTPDELWQVEHPPIYTLGVAAKPEHFPRVENGIPLLKTDRGGQITYHGPGQIVVYTLLDLRRRNLGVRALVRRLEQAVIELLKGYGIEANARQDAPGVYVEQAKVAALGLRVRNGCCYHGLSLNVDMDLSPFRNINPCGYPNLEVTQLRDLGISDPVASVADELLGKLASGI